MREISIEALGLLEENASSSRRKYEMLVKKISS